MPLKVSARNRLKGKIVEVKKGVITTHVSVGIGGGAAVAVAIPMNR